MLSKDGIAIIFSDCVVQHGYNNIIHANNKYEFKMKCDLMGLDIKFFEYKIRRSETGKWIGAFIDVDISENN